MLRDRAKNCIQRTDPKGRMRRYGNAVLRRLPCLQDYVASHLVHANILPMFAERVSEFLTREISW